MTLVVARQSSQGLTHVVADMRLSHRWDTKRGYSYAGLKNVIFDDALLVAYAGNADFAVHTLKNSQRLRGGDLVDALCRSAEAAGDAEDRVEYLIADTTTGLQRIRNDGAEPPTRATWIGDDRAFDLYQQAFHSEASRPWVVAAEEDRRLVEVYGGAGNVEAFVRMEHAISALHACQMWPEELLVDSDPRPDLECIGEGFVWADSKGGFHYREQTLIVTGVDTEIVGTDPQPIQVGTTADGAFSCSLLAPTSAGIGLVGLYSLLADWV